MKSFYKFPLFLSLYFFIQHFSFGQSNNSLFQNSEKDVVSWYTNSHFHLTEIDDVVHVQIDKMPWEAFSYQLGKVDLSQTPLLSLKVNSDIPIKLRIDLLDQTLTNQVQTPVVKAVPESDGFKELLFDFSKLLQHIDASQITQLQFFVEPGKKFKGKIKLKDISFFGQKNSNASLTSTDFLVQSNLPQKKVIIKSKHLLFNQVKIYNSMKQLISSQSFLPSLSQSIEVNRLSSGVYFIELIDDNESIYLGTFAQ